MSHERQQGAGQGRNNRHLQEGIVLAISPYMLFPLFERSLCLKQHGRHWEAGAQVLALTALASQIKWHKFVGLFNPTIFLNNQSPLLWDCLVKVLYKPLTGQPAWLQ